MLAFSTFSKNKEKMLYFQIGDCLFHSIGNILLGNFAAVSTNWICAGRNLLNAKNRNNTVINIIIMILLGTIGIVVNQKGIIGLLPVIASLEYTICMYKFKSPQALRCSLLVNMIFYIIHDFTFMLYTSAIGKSIIVIITIYNIIRNTKKQKRLVRNTRH